MTEENKYRALYLDFVKHQHEVNPPVRSIDAVREDVTFRTDGKTFAEVCFALSGWPLTAEEEKECWAKLNEVEAERIRRDNRRLSGMNA